MATEVATLADFAARYQSTLPGLVAAHKANYAITVYRQAELVNTRALGRVPAVITKVNSGTQVATAVAALAAVRALQRVTFEFDVADVDDVLRFIAAELPKRSPRVSGDYIRGHTLLADGVEISMTGPYPKAREYTFVNSVPYARKLEFGTTEGGRPFVIQVQPYIYEGTAQAARRAFPKADIKSSVMAFSGGASGRWAASSAGRRFAARARGGNPKLHHQWLTRQPCIIVRP